MKKPRLTLTAINKELEKHFPHVQLVRGEGYYYIYSDDIETGLRIAGMYSSSIYVNQLRHMTMEQWIEAVRELFDETKNRAYGIATKHD